MKPSGVEENKTAELKQASSQRGPRAWGWLLNGQDKLWDLENGLSSRLQPQEMGNGGGEVGNSSIAVKNENRVICPSQHGGPVTGCPK